MPNRDEYFFDICWEAGLNPSDPHDWISIGILFYEPGLSDEYILSFRDISL